MKEQDFINVIKNETKSPYLGDDCAYLKDLGIVVTQDNFVEDVHFKREWATAFQIGYKATIVNISDILASGAKPAYLSIGLSLPNNIDIEFIKEFYEGVMKASNGAEVIGGDITGSDKIFVSITAIGKTEGRKISSRSNAKKGYVIISNGEFGLSSDGLKQLQNGIKMSKEITAHLEPVLSPQFSEDISTQIDVDYAMMDTSDGLADALFQIAKNSNVTIKSKKINGIFGAEDYNLVAAVPKDFLPKIKNYILIGEVVDFKGYHLEIENEKIYNYDDLNLYNHFN